MSSRSQAAHPLMDGHHSTLHAFFLAAKESGCTEFELQLVASARGRIEFCISPRAPSEMSARFEIRGNMVRPATSEASLPAPPLRAVWRAKSDETDICIDYGGTRSGEEPVRVSLLARKMDWTNWSL